MGVDISIGRSRLYTQQEIEETLAEASRGDYAISKEFRTQLMAGTAKKVGGSSLASMSYGTWGEIHAALKLGGNSTNGSCPLPTRQKIERVISRLLRERMKRKEPLQQGYEHSQLSPQHCHVYTPSQGEVEERVVRFLRDLKDRLEPYEEGIFSEYCLYWG